MNTAKFTEKRMGIIYLLGWVLFIFSKKQMIEWGWDEYLVAPFFIFFWIWSLLCWYPFTGHQK